MLCQFMTLVSFSIYVHVASRERAAVKRANGGKLPHLHSCNEAQEVPVAAVARALSDEVPAPSNHPRPDASPVPMATGGPVAESSMKDNGDSALDSSMGKRRSDALAEESVAASAGAKSKARGGLIGFVVKSFHSVRTDSELGFR
jgi:hypothetical protein